VQFGIPALALAPWLCHAVLREDQKQERAGEALGGTSKKGFKTATPKSSQKENGARHMNQAAARLHSN
jgi:hypothetical protein